MRMKGHVRTSTAPARAGLDGLAQIAIDARATITFMDPAVPNLAIAYLTKRKRATHGTASARACPAGMDQFVPIPVQLIPLGRNANISANARTVPPAIQWMASAIHWKVPFAHKVSSAYFLNFFLFAAANKADIFARYLVCYRRVYYLRARMQEESLDRIVRKNVDVKMMSFPCISIDSAFAKQV